MSSSPSSRARSFAGAIAGLVMALLAPTLLAVAGHSGSDPALATASAGVELRRGATITFGENIPGGYRTLRAFVWAQDYADATATQVAQSVERGYAGELVLVIQKVVGSSVSTTTWRAPLGAGGATFVWSPDARTVVARGTLQASGKDPCIATLVWSDDGPNASDVGTWPSMSPPPGMKAGMRATLFRWSHLIRHEISCWGPASGAGANVGSGWIWAASDQAASVQR